MDDILGSLSGPYAYLVVAQILIITGLLVALFWLVIRKLQELALTTEPAIPLDAIPAPPKERDRAEAVLQQTAANVAKEAEMVANFEAAKKSLIQEWTERVQVLERALETERAAAREAASTSSFGGPVGGGVGSLNLDVQAPTTTATPTELEEKVKYLESKLLEYEILQEEIGSLKELRTENERLMGEIFNLKKGSQVTVLAEAKNAKESNAPAPVLEASKPAAEVPVNPQIQAAAPAPEPVAVVEPVPLEAHPPPPPVVPAKEEASSVSSKIDGPALDNLLQELERISMSK